MSAEALKGDVVERSEIMTAFEKWRQDKSFTEGITEAGLAMAQNAFEELFNISVALYDHWYLNNQYRYRKMRETDRRKARIAIRIFIADLETGKVSL